MQAEAKREKRDGISQQIDEVQTGSGISARDREQTKIWKRAEAHNLECRLHLRPESKWLECSVWGRLKARYQPYMSG